MVLKQKLREEVEQQKSKLLALSSVLLSDLEIAADEVAYKVMESSGFDTEIRSGFSKGVTFCRVSVKLIHPNFGGYFNVQLRKNEGGLEVICPNCWDSFCVDASELEGVGT